ncbi:MAG: hypothetical protein KGL39_05295 [Patescibacteria group bacterium]|nr:hypothetical protein [Patescibacteria group bacterium]
MKNKLFALCAVVGALLSSHAMAQSNGGEALSQLPLATNPLSGSELMYLVQNGFSRQTTAAGLAQYLSINGGLVPSAANNAQLNALSSTYAPYVLRAGFASIGDAPLALYAPEASCPVTGPQPDGGACVATSDGKFWVLMPQSGTIDARIWGAVANATLAGGGTDSATSINAAMNYCSFVGGGRVNFGSASGYFLVNSANVNVPYGCTFGDGRWLGDESASALFDETNAPAIILNPTYTINLANNSALDGIAVFQKGLTVPTTIRTAITGYATFAGTAITAVGGSTFVRNAYVVGFNQCFESIGNQRPIIEHFRGDCNNGLDIQGAHDVGYVRDAEIWPFYVQNSGFAVVNYAVSAVANSSGSIAVTIPSSNALIAGDTVIVNGVGGFTGANNRWLVASVASGVVVLNQIAAEGGGASQSTPVTTGTWIAGSTQVAVANLGSLAVGQSCTATNLSGPIVGIDYNSKKLIFAAASITGAGTGATITCTNAAYTSGGALTLQALRTGVAFGVADSQGYTLTDTFAGTWDTGYNMYSINTNGFAYWTQLNNAKCDDETGDETTTCVKVNGSSGKPVMGVIWNGGLVTATYGTAFWVNGWTAINASQNKMIAVNGGVNQNTRVAVSVQTGAAAISNVDLNLAVGSLPNYFPIADAVASVHINGCECSQTTLSFNSATGQGLTFGGLDNLFAVASLGGGGSAPTSINSAAFGQIAVQAPSGGTPNKWMRSFGGSLQWLNSAFSTVIASMNDNGSFTAVGAIYASGTAPTLTTGTCSGSSWVGGNIAGKFTAPTCAAGTIILSGLPTMPNGWGCTAFDQTTPADTLKQTANTASSVTFTSTTANNDVVVVTNCTGF